MPRPSSRRAAATPDSWRRRPLAGAVDRHETGAANSAPEIGRWISILTGDPQAEVHPACGLADPRSSRHPVAAPQIGRQQLGVGDFPPVGMTDHDVHDAGDGSAIGDGAGGDSAYHRQWSNPVLDPPVASAVPTGWGTEWNHHRSGDRRLPAWRGHCRRGLEQHEPDQDNRCDRDDASSHDGSSRQSDSDGRRSVERGRAARRVRIR